MLERVLSQARKVGLKPQFFEIKVPSFNIMIGSPYTGPLFSERFDCFL